MLLSDFGNFITYPCYAAGAGAGAGINLQALVN